MKMTEVEKFIQYPVYLENSVDAVKSYLEGADFVVCDKNVHSIYGNILKSMPEKLYILDACEQNKTLQEYEKICKAFVQAKLTRGSRIVALGGGVTGDLTGFAASSYMRGVKYIQIPTTLLSMCDSCIGGKTGVNFEGLKNYLGAFYNPASVVICSDFIQTIDEREFLSGVGEIIKTVLLNAENFARFKVLKDKIKQRDKAAINEMIKICVHKKAEVVSYDFFNLSTRNALNMGHTIGHALECLHDYKYSHGECVLSGIYYEMLYFGKSFDFASFDEVSQTIREFQPEPIPITDNEKFMRLMSLDKKIYTKKD